MAEKYSRATLSRNFLKTITRIKNPDEITTLANKYYEIPEDYEPKDLVDMEDDYANNMYGTLTLRKEAYEKFKEMCNASRKDGVKFYILEKVLRTF